jgi:hypothetical protein
MKKKLSKYTDMGSGLEDLVARKLMVKRIINRVNGLSDKTFKKFKTNEIVSDACMQERCRVPP